MTNSTTSSIHILAKVGTKEPLDTPGRGSLHNSLADKSEHSPTAEAHDDATLLAAPIIAADQISEVWSETKPAEENVDFVSLRQLEVTESLGPTPTMDRHLDTYRQRDDSATPEEELTRDIPGMPLTHHDLTGAEVDLEFGIPCVKAKSAGDQDSGAVSSDSGAESIQSIINPPGLKHHPDVASPESECKALTSHNSQPEKHCGKSVPMSSHFALLLTKFQTRPRIFITMPISGYH